MSKIKTFIKLLKMPIKLIPPLANKGMLNWMPDKIFLKLMYKSRMGKSLNLDNPRSFSEKLQWLKLYDRKPWYSRLVDKYEVRSYIEETIGKEYLIPLYGVWDDPDEIDFDGLPDQFVLKCTHDSGSVIICQDKTKLDKNKAKKKLKRAQRFNFYYCSREWPYKNVKPRIIAEKYMANNGSTTELSDYKWFCFDGIAKVMFVVTDRHTPGVGTKMNYFDMEFRHLPFTNGAPNATHIIEKPANFELMRELAERISKGLPHVRVDFYEADGRVYFGEITFFDGCGMTPFEPDEWDDILGSWIQLPEKTSQ